MLTKIAALVAVVAVVGIAAAILLSADDDEKENVYFEGTDPVLSIFGNADGDMRLDDNDIEIIESVIAENGSAADYPLCDANQDGAIDSEDIDLVKKIIAREECRVNVLCLGRDGSPAAVEVDYPLRDVATFGSSINANILYIGGEDYVAGYNAASYPQFEARLIDSGAVSFGGSSTKFNLVGFMAVDGALHDKNGKGIGAFIVDATRMGNIGDDTYAALEASGTPMLFFNVIRMDEEVSITVTLGFLFGEETYRNALALADACEPVIEKVERITSGLSENERNVVVGVTMGYMLMPATSDNYINIKEAGGYPLHEKDAGFNKIIDIGTSLKLSTTENVLVNYDDAIDSMISVRSVDTGITDIDLAIISNWEKNMRYFEDLDCYEDFFYVNNLLPACVKIAYMVENMYPEKTGSGFGDEVFGSISKVCRYMDGCTLENTFTDCTYADYLKAKSGGEGESDEPSDVKTATAKEIAEAFLAANPATAFTADADTIAAAIAAGVETGAWSVKDGATGDSATLIYTYQGSSGPISKELVVERDGKAANRFATVSATMAADSNYTMLDVSGISDVKVTAGTRTIPSGAFVTKFVVQYGSVIVDGYSDFLVNLGKDGAAADALDVVKAVADAVKAGARTVSWSIKDGATDAEAVLVETYESSKGASSKEIAITRGASASGSSFDVKAAGIPSSYTALDVDVDNVNVKCTAATRTMGSLFMVKFVLLYGDVLVDGATDYFCSYNADAADAEAGVQAFIAALTIPA